MSKISTVSFRIDPNLKQEIEIILQQLGLTTSQALMLFFKQIQLNRGLPFRVELPQTPNQVTEEALKEKNLPQFNSIDDLFNDLDH